MGGHTIRQVQPIGGKSVLLHQAVHRLTTGGIQKLFQILLQEACMNVEHASLYRIRNLYHYQAHWCCI